MKKRPFLKWAGNKYPIFETIHQILPPGERLIEPFAGSAATCLNTQYSQYLLTDNNPDLIRLYRYLQKEGLKFIKFCEKFFNATNNSTSYYHLRECFNTTTNQRLKAALFLYLNRHGYNGLCRYNSTGKFNVPFGRYKQPKFPAQEMLFFHEKLQRVILKKSDFLPVMESARSGDIIYCDPPYIPLSKTAYFTSYSKKKFGVQEHQILAHTAMMLARKGITTIISNHDTPFVRQLYHQAHIISLQVARSISRNAHDRKEVKEVLAIFSD